MLALLLTGCTAAAPAQSTDAPGRTLMDCMGREVELPDSVDSVACLYAYTGHVAVLLGCEDRIVAVVDGLKRDQLMQRKVPEIQSMPAPYTSGAVNAEELAAAAPDFIFLRKSVLQNAGETEKLNRLGIPYAVIEYETMEDQLYSIQVMGQALGREEAAEAYADYYNRTINLVRQRISQIPEEARIRVYHSVNEVVRTDIPGTLSYQVLEAAGCRNVVDSSQALRLDGDKGYVTVEQIYLWDPDVVLTNEPSAAEYFRTDEKFSGLRAVREGNVIQLPVGISRWGHPGSLESPLAALFLAKTLYPDAFADIDLNQEILDYYDTFFRISLTQEEVQRILSGEGMRLPKEGG